MHAHANHEQGKCQVKSEQNKIIKWIASTLHGSNVHIFLCSNILMFGVRALLKVWWEAMSHKTLLCETSLFIFYILCYSASIISLWCEQTPVDFCHFVKQSFISCQVYLITVFFPGILKNTSGVQPAWQQDRQISCIKIVVHVCFVWVCNTS